jgi:membrane protein
MGIWKLLRSAVAAWWNDNALRLGASVAFYTLFAIAPILIVAIAIAGAVFGAEAVRGEIVGQIDQLVGTEGGRAVQALLEGASKSQSGWLATIIGTVTLVLTASGAFLELQAAFNTIWRVTPDPEGYVREFLIDRLRSFGLVVAVGFLLLVSLAASAAIAALGAWVGRWTSAMPIVLQGLNIALSLVIATGLFALLFKFLPDVELEWRDVITGALVTAVLFTAGKELIGLYLGRSATASAYGAAGSVVVLLLWVYYTSQLVLVGAEFTRLYADRTRGRVPTSEFADQSRSS